jgi:hypothetical protein
MGDEGVLRAEFRALGVYCRCPRTADTDDRIVLVWGF